MLPHKKTKKFVVQKRIEKSEIYFLIKNNLLIIESYVSLCPPNLLNFSLVDRLMRIMTSSSFFTKKTTSLYTSAYQVYKLCENRVQKFISFSCIIMYAYVCVGVMKMYERKDIIFDIETLTLDPLEEDARIVAIGVRCEDFHKVLTADKEIDLLRTFWALPFFKENFRLIGFNSFTFDLPYLLVRSFKYGIKVPDFKGKSVDLRFVLSYGNKFKNGKLSDYASLFLKNDELKLEDGHNVKEWWGQGRIEFIELYCGRDVFITYKIFEIWSDTIN